MIPSTAPPFAMTRWVAQTRLNRGSITPYNYSDTSIHGFQGTHQHAIRMGESGPFIVVSGAGTVRPNFEDRGMNFSHANETAIASYYAVVLDAIEGGRIRAEQSASTSPRPNSAPSQCRTRPHSLHTASRVGHLRFTFEDTQTPYVQLEATRAQVSAFLDSNVLTYPNGTITIDPAAHSISGSNPERQNFIVDPNRGETVWSAYFVARFDQAFVGYGTAQNGTVHEGVTDAVGPLLSGFVRFGPGTRRVGVGVGVSFISVEQARRNLDREIPDGTELEGTAYGTREARAEKLDRIRIEGASEDRLETFYTGVFHTLQVRRSRLWLGEIGVEADAGGSAVPL